MKLNLKTVEDCDQALVEVQERLSLKSLDPEKAKHLLCYVEYIRLARHIATRWGEDVLANQRTCSSKCRQASPLQIKLTKNIGILDLYQE